MPRTELKISAFLKNIRIRWIYLGIEVILVQLWPGDNGSDHHGWSLLMVINVHYYIIDLRVRAILTGAKIGDTVRTLNSRNNELHWVVVRTTKNAWYSWWSLSVLIFDHYITTFINQPLFALVSTSQHWLYQWEPCQWFYSQRVRHSYINIKHLFFRTKFPHHWNIGCFPTACNLFVDYPYNSGRQYSLHEENLILSQRLTE